MPKLRAFATRLRSHFLTRAAEDDFTAELESHPMNWAWRSGSVSPSEGESRRFESCRPDHQQRQ